jgi:hypothetical protein
MTPLNRLFSRKIDLLPNAFGAEPLCGTGQDEIVYVEKDEYRLSPLMYAASLAGTATGAYHGYKRNHGSIGWAIGWGLLGGVVPIITIPVSLAQGFGKPAGR